ncbi:helix-turn-helix domain-containing protein [Streptomyces zhihengii]|uniref:Helix-turn-helix transcriptional regulator n=1 Tax=Streptomyces zhihengii TaxID=1818004 RepID=A0ABS2V4P0_9ACTN|nr:helix-turn-helix transcriptional regulator [Streptomyces zhihengii]MBM9624814.1 helix-turn-helix transcriptional regulator [Streptomyces zhihengii]
MATSPSSSVQAARRVLADRLCDVRRDAGLSGKQLAEHLGWYPSKVSRIEHARTAPSAEDVRAWCLACGVPEHADDLVASLRAVEGMFVEWRRMERAGLHQAQAAVLPLFERTSRFRSYSSWLVPGLLQTRAYTEAVLRAVQRRRVAVDDVEAAVAARIERQQVLLDPGKTFAFLLEESVLLSSIGDRDVLAGQLEHLAAVASRPNLSVGIVPAGPGRSRMPVEGFWIYDTTQVNVELISGYLTITQAHEITQYAGAFAELADQCVYGAAARQVIGQALARLRPGMSS